MLQVTFIRATIVCVAVCLATCIVLATPVTTQALQYSESSPTPPTVPPRSLVELPTSPVEDPCNPSGISFNATWRESLSDSTETVGWLESEDGTTRTAALINPYSTSWSDNSNQPIVFELVESGRSCIPMPLPELALSDPCNPPDVTGNAFWLPPNDTEVLDWMLFSNLLSVRIVDNVHTFPDGSVHKKFGSPRDSGIICELENPVGQSIAQRDTEDTPASGHVAGATAMESLVAIHATASLPESPFVSDMPSSVASATSVALTTVPKAPTADQHTLPERLPETGANAPASPLWLAALSILTYVAAYTLQPKRS